MDLRLFSADDVVRALPMAEAIEGMKAAYAQLSAGKAVLPLRAHIPVTAEDTTLVMPAYLPESEALGLKVVSVFGSNPPRGLKLINAVVIVLDASTGQPLALMEGGAVTAIRTGAASGAATDVLARHDAHVVAIFGAGVQARTQLEAVCTVRAIREVRVYSPEGADAFATEMVGRGPIPDTILIADSPEAAVRDADIICTATTAHAPVFDGRWLKPGTHVNAIGSFTPVMQEIDAATLQRSLVVVDSREAALAETGDLLIPIEQGEFAVEDIHAELGEIINGTRSGRTSSDQITLFKSVGVAVQDAVAAQIIWRNGTALGLGTTATL